MFINIRFFGFIMNYENLEMVIPFALDNLYAGVWGLSGGSLLGAFFSRSETYTSKLEKIGIGALMAFTGDLAHLAISSPNFQNDVGATLGVALGIGVGEKAYEFCRTKRMIRKLRRDSELIDMGR